MFRITFLIATVLVAAFAAPAPEGNDEMRVLGGTTALAGEAPYMVSLRTTSNFHFCGGSILNSHTIITAANCLTDRTASTTIAVAGTTLLNSGGYRYAVESLIPHPDYNITSVNFDIALVITSTYITYTTTIARIGLTYNNFIGEDEDVAAKFTGWGTNSYPGGSLQNSLQAITLNTITLGNCTSRLAALGQVNGSQMCTLNKAGEGLCQGDSGSPLVDKGLLIGVASWGSPCAVGLPDVFTRAPAYYTWIINNAQN